MVKRAKVHIDLDLTRASDREYYEILKDIPSPILRKNFLISSALYYSHSPLYRVDESIRTLLEELASIREGLRYHPSTPPTFSPLAPSFQADSLDAQPEPDFPVEEPEPEEESSCSGDFMSNMKKMARQSKL